MDGWVDGWMYAEGDTGWESNTNRHSSVTYRVRRGKGALSAFKRNKSLLMCQGPMG